MFLDLFIILLHNTYMENKTSDNQESLIKFYNNINEKDAFDICVSRLVNLKHNLKDENFAIQWISDLLNWQLAKNNINEIDLYISSKNILPTYKNNTISISSQILTIHNLYEFAQLTDTIIHEFTHYVTDINNSQVKKDEFGNKSSKYLKSYPYWYIYNFLDKYFDNKILLGNIVNGLYYNNIDEKNSRQVAYTESLQLVEKAIDNSTFIKKHYMTKLLKKVKKLKINYYYNYVKNISCCNFYQSNLEEISKDFQRNLEIKSDDDYTSLYVARYLYISDELDQINFKKLIAQNQINSAFSLLDEVDFKNNKENIIQFAEFLKQNNMDIKNTQFKTLDKDVVLKVINQYNSTQKAQNLDKSPKQEIIDKIQQNNFNNKVTKSINNLSSEQQR